MIDCHAHLAAVEFSHDLPAVLERAEAAGVEAAIVVCEGADEVESVLSVCAAHPLLHPCLGVHPERADLAATEAVVAAVRRVMAGSSPLLVAIGEVGLDYWLAKQEPARALQREVLAAFVALSRETGLPLNVHSRAAGHYTIDLLAAEGAEQVLLHAFDGRPTYALRGVDLGYRFSIPPSIVRSPQKQKLVRRLPLEALCLESDSPVLGPTREERNEPCNVSVAAAAIAELKQRPLEEIVQVTSANARALFRL